MFITRSRLAPLVVVAASVATVACADSATAPAPIQSVHRSSSIDGDTLSCRNGWTVMNGRYVCNEL